MQTVLPSCSDHRATAPLPYRLSAMITHRFGTIVMSNGASSPELSNMDIYRNFFSIAPSYSSYRTLLHALLAHFSWGRICIVYDTDSFYLSSVEGFISFFDAQSNGASVILSTSTDSNQLLFLRGTACRIFVVMASLASLPSVLCSALKNQLV